MKLYVSEIVRNVLHADFLFEMSVLFEQICQSSCSKLLEQVYAADRYSLLHLVPKLNGIEQSSVYHSFDEATALLSIPNSVRYYGHYDKSVDRYEFCSHSLAGIL